jgi:hypothetical protein
MPTAFTFARLAQLCLALADDPSSGTEPNLVLIDSALRLDAWARQEVLKGARRHEFVQQRRAGVWALTEKGNRLATEIQEALDKTENKETSLPARSFATFLPKGDEALG